MNWLGLAVCVIKNGSSSSGRWGAEGNVANNHAVTWLERGDLIGGGIEAGKKISKTLELRAIYMYSQVVHVHVEHGDRDEGAIVCGKVQLRGPVVTLVVLDQRRSAG